MERLRASGVKATWTKLHNIHLTMKFLGDTPETLLPDVCRAVIKGAAKVEPFELRFVGAGAFPTMQRPQTLWIGVKEGLAEITELRRLLQDNAEFDAGVSVVEEVILFSSTLDRVNGPTYDVLARAELG
jgi:2'-5' RNA ligase